MKSLKLSAAEADAIDILLSADLDDPVELVRLAGYDPTTFFENSIFEYLDFSNSNLSNISFSGSHLKRCRILESQSEIIFSSGARKVEGCEILTARDSVPNHNIESAKGSKDTAAVSAYAEALRRITIAISLKATTLDLSTQLQNLENIPTEILKAEKLEIVDLSGTSVDDLSTIFYLPKLREVDASDTKVLSIQGIQEAHSLNILRLDRTSVNSISELSGLSELRIISLNGTLVSDVTPLSNMNTLQEIDINNSKVEDVSAISNLRSLKKLMFWPK